MVSGDRSPSAGVENLLDNARRLVLAGRLDLAATFLRQILAIAPRHAESLHLLGATAFQAGRHEAAAALIGEAIAVDGDVAAYHATLGAALKELGRLTEAEAACRRAVDLAPNVAEAHFNLANALKAQARLAESELHYRRAIELRPAYPKALCNLGNALIALDREEEGLASLREAIRLKPDYAEAHSNAALALIALDRWEEAAAACRTALALAPHFAEAHGNLAMALHELGELDAAATACRTAIALAPERAQAYANLGLVLAEQGRLADGIASLREAVVREPDHVDSHFNLALLLLRAGEFEEGWREYEWRWRRKEVVGKVRDVARSPWDGGPVAGGTILVWAEQGLGDSLQFIRYVPPLAAAGWRVILEVPTGLRRLVARCTGVTTIAVGDPLPPFDVQCPMLTLARLAGTTLADIPATVPYLHPDPARVAAWRRRLSGGGLTVGIVWRGDPNHRHDRHRSVDPARFAPLLATPGLTVVSVQKNGRAEEFARLGLRGSFIDAGPELADFEDTAGLVAALDLVITVDTAVGHLAGALGVPTWVLLDTAADWRWLGGREDSPWYPSLRLFRQSRVGDWGEVIGRAAQALRRLAAGRMPADDAVRLFQAGRLDQAAELCRHRLDATPRHADSLHLLGVIAYREGRHDAAIAAIDAAITVNGGTAPYFANLGAALREAGRPVDAEAACRKAIALWPDFAEAHFNLGNALRDQGRRDEAAEFYRRAVVAKPDYAKAQILLARLLAELGRQEEAAEASRRAVALRPDDAGAHHALAVALYGLGQRDEAVACCTRALDLVADYPEARRNLAKMLFEQGRVDESRACLRQGLALRPDDLATAILSALTFPLFPTAPEIPALRGGIAVAVAAIAPAEPPRLDPQEVLVANFYLAYHGLDDRTLQADIAAMYRRVAPSLGQTLPSPGSGGERLRVAFLSSHLSDHTIGLLNVGLIEKLDRRRFQVVVLRTRPADGPLARRIDLAADEVVALPGDLDAARRTIAGLNLDLLYYPDIGMDPFTYYLAFSRLAPVQAVTWGHPDTTGLESIDYFVSAEVMEPAGATAHYIERLILLDRLNVYYSPPTIPAAPPSRAALGLPDSGTLYGCPQSLFKFHPDFDAVLAEIAAGDPTGHIVLLEGHNPVWSEQLRARWANAYPSLLERTVFLPRLSYPRFLALQGAIDVLLDPIHFGGGNTMYEAMAWGTPVVTWPGAFLRGRIAAGAYRQMGGAQAPVAPILAEYAPLALALGHDPDRRQALRRALRDAAARELFADSGAVRALEDFFAAAVAAARRGEKLPAGWRVQPTAPGEG